MIYYGCERQQEQVNIIEQHRNRQLKCSNLLNVFWLSHEHRYPSIFSIIVLFYSFYPTLEEVIAILDSTLTFIIFFF